MARQRFPVLQPAPVMCCTIGLTKGSRRLRAVIKPDSFFFPAASSLGSAGVASAGVALAVFVSAFFVAAALGSAGLGFVFGATPFAKGSCLAGAAPFA